MSTKASKSGKRLTPQLESLVDQILQADPSGDELGTFRAAATAMALTEAGISTQLLSANVVFDPEKWQTPIALLALKVRGVVYAGLGRYGWEDTAEALRSHLGIKGDYREIERAYQIPASSILEMNPTRTAEFSEELERARAFVGQLMLEKKTPAAKTSKRSGMRL